MTYGNGLQIKYVYDALDRISEVQYNVGEGGTFETVYTYTYDAGGRLFSVTDVRNEQSTVYRYDLVGNVLQTYVYNTEDYVNPYPWEAEANKLGGSKSSQSWKPSLPQGSYSGYWDLISLFFD